MNAGNDLSRPCNDTKENKNDSKSLKFQVHVNVIMKANISKHVQSYVGIRPCIKEGKYKMLSRHGNDSKEDKMKALIAKVSSSSSCGLINQIKYQ